jgi:hypothetical protein
MATPVSLDRVTSLAVDPGAPFVLRGLMTTPIDGSSFDAVSQWDGLAAGAWRTGGLFDLASGGLRVVEQHADRHEYVLASTGAVGPACAAIGAESPCLVPRVAALAHERLRTTQELTATLSGELVVDANVALPAGAPARELVGALTVAALVLPLVIGVGLAGAYARHRAHSALGRVRRAVREALRATRDDVTLEPLRSHVRAMLTRAADLDKARRACARRLARIDLAGLERKRDDYAHSSVPESVDALAWIAAECEEGAVVKADLTSSILGMERIECALRVMVLRAREHRGVRARVQRGDPVDAIAAELVYREEARSDVEGMSGQPIAKDSPFSGDRQAPSPVDRGLAEK